MNFFTHKIANPTGDALSFNEWLADFLTKQASEAKPGLGQDTSNESRGEMRGQVINNDNEDGAHSYQEGESVDGKKEEKSKKSKESKSSAKPKLVKAECGKEMGESDDAGKVTEKHTEAGPGDDQNPDPKVMINNDPNYQKGESAKGKKGKEDKGQTKDKAKSEDKEDKEDKKASAQVKFEKIAALDHNKKMQLFAYLSSQKTNILLPFKTADGKMVNKPSLAYVEAMVGETYANMQDDEKKWFKAFWSVLYPDSFVEEMVADR
jgi:hypothetical protein